MNAESQDQDAPDPAPPPRRQFTEESWAKVLAPWYKSAPDADLYYVSNVIMAVADGSWTSLDHVQDLVRPAIYHFLAKPDLVVSVQIPMDYRTWACLVRIGPYVGP